MLFCNKDLINCFGFSARSFYRRLKDLKTKKTFSKTSPGYFYRENEAAKIAREMGFFDAFNKFKNDQLNGKKRN